MKPKLDLVEFYISHTCNFGCSGCNRFNNFRFLGHESWHEYADVYRQWSEKLDIGWWSILGGEPTLNKDLIHYIRGLRALWPDSHATLITNGSFQKRFDQELYDAVKDCNIEVHIGLHNTHRRTDVITMIEKWLCHPLSIKRSPDDLNDLPGFTENWINSYNKIKSNSWPNCDNVNDWDRLPENIKKECIEYHNFSPEILSNDRKKYWISDANNVKVSIDLENFFVQSAMIKKPETNTFTLHNSDREKAHNDCFAKECHHMMYGKLSKCGQSALFSEFSKQFQVDLSDEDRALVEAHKPCSVNDDVVAFVENIKNSIPQCKFCPEEYVREEIFSAIDKDKFANRINI